MIRASSELAPALNIWGTLAPRIVRLLKHRPTLARSLLCAPPRAMHAVAAFLHHAPDSRGADAVVALHIEEADPRALLRSALPAAPPRLYRALDRCGGRVRKAVFYARIASAADGPFADLLLDSTDLIDDNRLDRIESLAEMDPVIWRLPRAVLAERGQVDAIESIRRLLEACGVDADSLLTDLPHDAGMAAVTRRLMRAVDGLRAPDVSISLPQPTRLIESVADLRRIGRDLRVCVQSAEHQGAVHWIRLVTGASVYVLMAEPRTLIELQPIARNVFTVAQLGHEDNQPVARPVTKAIHAALRDAGLVIVRNPAGALAHLERRCARGWNDAGEAFAEMMWQLDDPWA